MADQYLASMIDSTRNISFDSGALLTSSAINALHFPGLTTSGISDSGGNRRASILLDGIGMCESMTESFCSTGGQDDSLLINNTNTLPSDPSTTNNLKLERKDSTTQRKRRSRKSQYDASIDGPSLDKIETVALIDEQNEPDDVWLFEVPKTGHKSEQTTDNIFSWVHKEFKTNDINASKHRLLCKLDDMSHARTIRSVSCHNFADNQKFDSVKRSLTEQQVRSDNLTQRYSSLDSLDYDTITSSNPVKNGRLSSPLRTITPLFNENGNNRLTSSTNLSPLRLTMAASENNNAVTSIGHSREVSREREKEPPLDYTDLEVMAKVQLENLRQAERQGPLSKRFGGSNVSLASTSSGTSVSISNRTGAKPPVAPKPTTTRNGVKVSNYCRSNTQTIIPSKTNGCDVPVINEPKLSTTRASVLPPNSANNNRARPPTARPIQAYRGSQTSYINNPKVQIAPSSVQRNSKNPVNNFASTLTAKEFSSNENGLLNDVSNKPLTAPIQSQVGLQRRTLLPQTSTYASAEQITPSSSIDMRTNRQTILPRSSSTLSQGRKSGIPTVGKQQKPTTTTLTRPTSSIPFSQSSHNMMVTRTVRAQASKACPPISEFISSWSEGCY